MVCDPRKNALLKSGNKEDRIDARKLATLLRGGLLSAVYHGENGVGTLKELARSYLTITKDLTSVMNRLKALYRSRAIPRAGKLVYAPRHRAEWPNRLSGAGLRRRAEQLYQQLDMLSGREIVLPRRRLCTTARSSKALDRKATAPTPRTNILDLKFTGPNGTVPPPGAKIQLVRGRFTPFERPTNLMLFLH